MNNNWLDCLEHYVLEHPYAEEDELFSQFKELKNSPERLAMAWAHVLAKRNPHVSTKMLERMFPEFYPQPWYKRFLKWMSKSSKG